MEDKILKEPFYSELYKDGMDLQQLEHAGFFYDSNEQDIDYEKHVNIPCTPINFLKPITTEGRKCVLISTGAFSPLHQGHIDMMVKAKEVLENNNWNVIGGYLSPGHDEYIKQKTGKDWIPIGNRLKYATSLIKDYRWLSIDSWEGVFAPGAVNFTTVIYRLHLYLQKWYGDNVSVFFVCGADNARFSLAFSKYQESQEFGAVIVNRPTYNDRIVEDYINMNNVYRAHCESTMSSTQLRKNGFKIENNVSQVYLRMKWNYSCKLVKTILQNYFKVVWPIDIKEQLRSWLDTHTTVDFKNIINLDCESYFDHNLHICRVYDLFGQYKIGYTNRPGTKTIENQISAFPKKPMYLFDDDIFTGNTMRFVENLMNENGIEVAGKLSFLASNDNAEILDAKDFIFNDSDLDNGLVITFDGEKIRVPYIYPFVCPTSRASIVDGVALSKDMWEMNMKLLQNNLDTVGSSGKMWLTKLGFSTETRLFDVCKYYSQLMSELK